MSRVDPGVGLNIQKHHQIKLGKVKYKVAVHSPFISATMSRLYQSFFTFRRFRVRILAVIPVTMFTFFFEVPFMSSGQCWNGDNRQDPPRCTGSNFKVLVLFQRTCAFVTFTELMMFSFKC